MGSASRESPDEPPSLGAADCPGALRGPSPLRTVLPAPARPASEPVVAGGDGHRADRLGALIGASQCMRQVYDLVGRVARTNASVMISGETGTGKEIVAQTIHSLSQRKQEPFLPVNCGALSPALIESELFGHERGSFTGADRLHKGFFERANRGTLFLDEISEMPGDLQVRLLRVLETSAMSRVGGTETLKIDVRVIAATNQRPEQAVASGRLRQDLLYRLNVFPIVVPPLRERGHDVLLLAEEFLNELNRAGGTSKRFTAAGFARLLRHSWPGNVRELRNVVQRAFILSHVELGEESVLPGASEGAGARVPFAIGEWRASSLVVRLGTPLAEAERRLILGALDHFEGDKQKAAEALQISVKTIYNRLREYKNGPSAGRALDVHEKVASFGRASEERWTRRPPGP